MTPVKAAREAWQRSFGDDDPSLQHKLELWELCNFGPQQAYRNVLGAIEELGELSHAVLKYEQSIRGMTEDVALEAVGDAIADVTIYLINLASKFGLDFDILVKFTAAEVMKRDWKRFPKDGLTE